MPKYSYYCDCCKDRYSDWHGMMENPQECKSCGAGSKYLTRIPAIVSDMKASDKNEKIGSVVNSHIEQTKEELQREKEDLKKEMDI